MNISMVFMKYIKPGIILAAALLSLWIFGLPEVSAQNQIAERHAELQRQIEEIQRQIAEYQQQIETNQSQAKTLEREISTLNAQIRQIELSIQSLERSIDSTNLQIGEAENQISDINTKMTNHKEAIGQLLKIIYQNEKKSLTEILLAHDNLSDFFSALNDVKVNQENLQFTIDNMKALKAELETHQESLEKSRAELEQARQLEALERSDLARVRQTQNNLLKNTRGEEARYQQLVQQSQRNLEAIQNEITYLLQNGLTADDAVSLATMAAIRAGIRPAFLLAELEQESALGANVGKCLIMDATSGKTKHVTNGHIYSKGIHPTRDLGLLISITQELGKDPYQTPVSCGQGWGGAMGPAQFIPSTWMGYRDQVSQITGNSPANPWNFEDAFTAAALKLARDGASSKTPAGEIAASKRYYCGNAKSTASGCVNYANSVQRRAARIEQNL